MQVCDVLSTSPGTQLTNTHEVLLLGAWRYESGLDIEPAFMDLLVWSRGQHIFFVKGQRVNMFGCEDPMVSDATTGCHCGSVKAATQQLQLCW